MLGLGGSARLRGSPEHRLGRSQSHLPARHLGAAAALLGASDKARSYYYHEALEALAHLEFAIGEFQDMKMQPFPELAASQRCT